VAVHVAARLPVLSMTGVPVADDVTVADLERDPYPVYARLRREAPICYVPAVRLWFVTRWSDVVAAAEDPVRFPASFPGSPLDRTLGGRSVLTVDGPEHERMRAPMEQTLRPRKTEERAPDVVRRIADELIDAFADHGETELMAAFCEPLSVRSLAEVIGLRDLDVATLRRWFHEIATGTSNYEGDPAKQVAADETSAEVDASLRAQFEDQLAHPDGTMVSDMLHAESGDVDERMRAFMPTLKLALIGGLQEPGHGLGTTMVGLLSHADQLAAVRGDPDTLIRKAVDEGIRWISPIGTQGRCAGPDAEVQGVRVPEGEGVGIMVPSANRDETVWGPTADDYDLFRPRHANAAFGFGSHFCVGHQLARVQMRLGVRRLIERLPGLRLHPDREVSYRGWEYRGPVELRVRWDA
jgi:cytochrome P450